MKLHKPALFTRIACMLYVTVMTSVFCFISCRDKSEPPNPIIPNPTEGWGLVLRHAPILHRHYNDTITVRVFDSTGAIRGGIEVHSICTAGPNNITSPVITVSDTISRPWGTTFPLIYVGTIDSLDMDIVTSWAIRNEIDTVAETITSFKLTDPPPPYKNSNFINNIFYILKFIKNSFG